MSLLSVQNLLLALVIVVPGFITVFVSVSIGVVRREISKWNLLITSLTASLFVDSVYFALLQFRGVEITSPNQVSTVFFTPTFRPELVLGLLAFSTGFGVVGGVLLASNIHRRVRKSIWEIFGDDRHRKFHEPWEETLDETEWVHVLTSDGSYVNGKLVQYSDDEKEKQLAIAKPEWHFPGADEQWVEAEGDMELLFGDDIRQVSVSTSRKEESDTEQPQEDEMNEDQE